MKRVSRSSLALGLLWLVIPARLVCSGGVDSTRSVEPFRSSEESGGNDTPLSLQRMIERPLGSGETHTYRIKADAGQYLRISIAPRGLEISFALSDPGGAGVAEAENPVGIPRPEQLLAIADVSGDFILHVRSNWKSSGVGRYELTLDDVRKATPQDRCRVEAARFQRQGDRSRYEGVASSLVRAATEFNEALQLWRTAGDIGGEGRTLVELGNASAVLGDAAMAIDYYLESLPLLEAADDWYSEGYALLGIGSSYDNTGETDKAVDYFGRSLQLFRAHREVAGDAWALNHLGVVYNDLGKYQKAILYLEEALPLWARAGHRRGESYAHNTLGLAYRALGEKPASLEHFERALRLSREVRNPRIWATLGNIGDLFLSTGEVQKALDYYREAFEVTKKGGIPLDEAGTILRLGFAYVALGENRTALECLQQARALFHAGGDPFGEAAALCYSAEAFASLGETQQAIDAFRGALDLQRVTGDQWIADTLNHLGKLYVSTGDLPAALDSYGQALSAAQAVGNCPEELISMTGLAAIDALEGEPSRALARLELALTWSLGYQATEAEILFITARVLGTRGDLAEARTAIEASLDIVERLRSALRAETLRTSYFASVQERYGLLIDVLMRLHRVDPSGGFDALALVASERARARGLLDLLAEARADVRQSVDPALSDRERSLEQRLAASRTRQAGFLSRGGEPGAEVALAREIAELKSEQDGVEEEIRSRSPRYAALTRPEPMAVREIQGLLGDDTVLLEYALGEEQSFLWAIGRNGISSYVLPGRGKIEALAKGIYESWRSPSSGVDSGAKASRRYATELSKIVFAPVSHLLRKKKRLVIVAEGALLYVPFGALPSPAGEGEGVAAASLMAEHEIVTLPSASTLAGLRADRTNRPRPSMTLAVLADPVFDRNDSRIRAVAGPSTERTPAASQTEPEVGTQLARSARDAGAGLFRLPFTRREARAISQLVAPTQRLEALGFEASREMATGQELSRYRIVHFATHGLLDTVHPELSGLVFSLVDRQGRDQEGFLPVSEVFKLKLSADLVVLSACQTALGKEIRGEGLVGLTRAFMFAGAPTVVASLWRVDDVATAELMKRFYEGMLGPRKLRPAAALREAQVDVAKQERWRDPYYWAAFVLQGEWR